MTDERSTPATLTPSAPREAPREAPRVALIGVPFDAHSSFLRGPALAPTRVRAALHAGSMNMTTENGIDLAALTDWQDFGDLAIANTSAGYAAIEGELRHVMASGARVLALGGDHSITYQFLRATAPLHPNLAILHIDAHPDLYDEFEGNRTSHACPFARIMEEHLATRLVQVGIRAMNAHQRRQAERFGVEVIPMHDYAPDLMVRFDGPVYVSLDLDALDPAFAPGVSHHEPGGLSVRDVLRLLQRLDAPIIGADIVEYNPTRDHAEITAMVAAKFTKELLGLLLQSL